MVTDEMSQAEAQKLVIAAARRTEARMSGEPLPPLQESGEDIDRAIEIVNTEL